MALLGKVGKLASGVRRGAQSAASGAARSKTLAATVIGGSMIAGFAGKTSEAAISGTMDVAFGTPDADNYMLGGRDLTPSLAMGALMPGFLGAPARMKNAVDLGMYGAGSPEAFFAPIGIGAALGAAAGTYGAASRGGKAIKAAKAAKALGSRKRIIGAVAGAAFGTIAGGMAAGTAGAAIGTGVGAMGAAKPYRNNPDLFKNSPYYNTSLSTAERLNASGDIVLGMHNSRRG